jgi:hypothetical protein
MNFSKHILAATVAAAFAGTAIATPTPEEAKQLGTTLTAVGAEKAGNADKTIPAFDGGICTPPAGYKPTMGAAAGGGPYIDPFAAEKPLFRITAANLAQYADKVDPGTQELFKRYPSFAIDVYPSHRTACIPAWANENTIKRVMNPKLVGAGPGLANAHAQIPFPIPKSGYEAMWNSLMKFQASPHKVVLEAALMDASGTMTITAVQTIEEHFSYWDNSIASLPDDKPFRTLVATSSYPASQAGLKQMRYSFQRTDLKDDQAWSYVPGQRRVRLAPEFKYDTVSTTSGGLLIFDEINGFDGKMDKYDFKLVGKKEMYIPYNDVKVLSAPMADAMKKNFVNPDLMRWELHRVWVVEATLKPGQRHIQKKKVFYLDEDSWASPLYYALDQSGKVHHLTHFPIMQEYDKPSMRLIAYILYDMNRGIYGYQSKTMGRPEQSGFYKVGNFPANFFTPDAMAGSGVR